MTDDITPALSPAEWHEALRSTSVASTMLRRHAEAAASIEAAAAGGERAAGSADPSAHLRAAVALANHLLPEGHPRKITWRTVDALRTAVVVYHDAVGSTFGELGVRRHAWDEMANTTAVLASILPPRDGAGGDGRRAADA